MMENQPLSFIMHGWNGKDIIYYDSLINEFTLNSSSTFNNTKFTICLTDDERKQFLCNII